jgi:RimJ/RimL family protein N-acetyltransferase
MDDISVKLWVNKDESSDRVLQWAWHKMVDDGLVDTVLYEMQPHTLASFISMMSRCIILSCWVGEENAGLIWMSDMVIDTRTEVSFCFWKKFWNKKLPLAMGSRAVEIMHDPEGFDLKILHGRILASNRAALIFAKKLGFDRAGEISNGWDELVIVEKRR